MAKFEAILFDCDGVLAETERDGHRVAFNRTFSEFNIDTEWSVEDYGALLRVGGGKNRMRAFFLDKPELLEAAGLDNESEDTYATLHKRKSEIFQSIASSGQLPARAGIRRLITEALDAGKIVAVASTSATLSVEHVLGSVVDAETFAKIPIFGGDLVQKSKPDPQIYNLAMKELGITDPNTVAIVEDSQIGCEAGVRSGGRVIVTPSYYTKKDDFSGSKAVVSHIGDSEHPAELWNGIDITDAGEVRIVTINRLFE